MCTKSHLKFLGIGLVVGLGLISAFTANAYPQSAGPRWSPTGQLVTGRRGHTATLLPSGKVLITGGVGPNEQFLDSAEVYDPATGTWSATGALSGRRAYHTAVLLSDGKVLVVGGLSAANIFEAVSRVELYDPVTGAWRSNGSLLSDGIPVLLSNGKVLVVGGHVGDQAFAELYDPATGVSTPTGRLNTPRALPSATLLPDGKVLVAGGHIHPVETGLPSAELYDPETGSWRTTGNLTTGRFEHDTTLLPNGRVLALGGWEQGFSRALTAEVYDPLSGVWNTTGSPNTLTGGSGTQLLNGKVLVVGNSGAELYDPETGIWSSSVAPASAGTVTLLADGKVLVAGGRRASSNAELYDPGTPPGWTYTIADRGGAQVRTAGTSPYLQAGYARLQPDAANAVPAGLAIFGLRQNGVLVSEASVPASSKIRAGRIYAEVSNSVNTGIAIVNPNNEAATVSFYFTDSNGTDSTIRSFTMPENSKIASFLNEPPFSAGPSFRGTLTFTSTVPVSVIALRGLTNEHSEFLITTLPVADLSAPLAEPVTLAHFADGGGWTTQIILTNPTDEQMSGTVRFLGQGSPSIPAQPVPVTVNGQTSSTLQYAVAPRSSQRFMTAGTASGILAGSVRITPATNQRTPAALAIFSYRKQGVTVSEASLPAVNPANAFRVFVESAAAIQSGIAVANASSNPVIVRFEISNLQGELTGLSGAATIPGNGQVVMFLNQIQGFASLGNFQGVLRISSPESAAISVMALRGRTNERSDFLITAIPTVPENTAPSNDERFFPHVVDGGGYTTQFILFGVSAGQSGSGMIRSFGKLGQPIGILPLTAP